MQHVIEQKPNTNVKISLGNTDSWILFLGGLLSETKSTNVSRGNVYRTLGFIQRIQCLVGQPNFSSKNLLCCLENYA